MSTKSKKEEQEQQSVAPETTPDSEQSADPRIEEIQNCLRTFPELKAGYLCKAGPYFDKVVAESKLEEGEELIIVERPNSK